MRLGLPTITLTPSASITLGIVSLTMAIFWLMDLTVGIIPDHQQALQTTREQVSTTLALQISSLLKNHDEPALKETLETVRLRNPDILSIAVRDQHHRITYSSGPHQQNWQPPPDGKSDLNNVQIPIKVDDRPWAWIEIRYRPPSASLDHRGAYSSLLLPLLILLGGIIAYYLYLRRVLQHLDPSNVIPERVGTALDTLTEGVLITDLRHRIMLLNQAFRHLHPEAPHIKVGKTPCSATWLEAAFEASGQAPPWQTVIDTHRPVLQQRLDLPQGDGSVKNLLINASPVEDGSSQLKGCMTTFQDISQQVQTQRELERAQQNLEASNKQLEKQNKELYELANHDQLTGLFNRRAFFEKGERLFSEFGHSGRALACIMCDIDHFKRVNDTYGHAVGDEAIQSVAGFLKRGVRNGIDIVGRYGGEEFCILLPGVSLEIAQQVAERIRAQIDAKAGPGVRSIQGLKLTSSFGLATLSPETPTLSTLIDHADQALYRSKEGGRNRVTVFES